MMATIESYDGDGNRIAGSDLQVPAASTSDNAQRGVAEGE